jgi:hypothetical protein
MIGVNIVREIFSSADVKTLMASSLLAHLLSCGTLDSMRMVAACSRYTIRLSDPAEFTGLDFEDEVELYANVSGKDPEKGKPKDDDESSTRGNRRASVSGTAASAPKTTRRKREASLRLSEFSSTFKEVEQLNDDTGSSDAREILAHASTVLKFALVRAIQPGDVLETIHSLGRMKEYRCKTARVDVRSITTDRSNYPMNLTFVRKPKVTPSFDNASRPRRKRTKAKNSAPEKNAPAIVSILSSDEEEGDNAFATQETPLVSACSANGESTEPFVARSDPLPGYDVGDIVLTPMGPGFIQSHRIDRWADSLDHIVHPILLYKVALPFGVMFVLSRHVQLLEGSPYAQEQVIPSSLTRGDMVRLQPGVYLNDNLVNFYLEHLQRAGSKVHVFSSYFYTRISDLVAPGQKSTHAFRLNLWENLKRWIKNVDIWKQDILLIPINGSLHWSVVAVFHPGSLLQESSHGRVPCLVHLDSGKRFRLHGSATLFRRIRMFLMACLEHEDGETAPFADAAAIMSMHGLSPPVPAQPNETDCGVHMLEWIERLLENPLQITQEFLDAKGDVPPFGKDAFEQATIDLKRHHLQSLIYTLSQGDSMS